MDAADSESFKKVSTKQNGVIQQEPAGYTFGQKTQSDQTWGQTVSELPLLTQGHGDTWSGFGGEPPECFIGVRFQSGGQVHYGWIRLLLPTSQPPEAAAEATVFPVVTDWAYEARPDVPIRAGEVRPAEELNLFTVDFVNPDGTLHTSETRRSTGTFILDRDTLYYEMVLVGTHTNLNILDAANSKSVFDLVVAPSGLPGFPPYIHGEFKLSHPHIAAFNHGRHYVSVDQGTILGWIEPAGQKTRPRQ